MLSRCFRSSPRCYPSPKRVRFLTMSNGSPRPVSSHLLPPAPTILTKDEEAFVTQIKTLVHQHEAMGAVKLVFGDCFRRAPLPRDKVKAFLACHIAGVRDVPTSILSLAVRLSHECMKYDYFGGHAIAARTLFAASHEYGLQNTEALGIARTHFELYRDAIHSWGFTVDEILNHKDIFPESKALATTSETLATKGSIATALGCHLALEEAADLEFLLLWEGFSAYWKEYGLSGPEDPALGFYHIHIIQEPLHGSHSTEAMIRYLRLVPSDKTQILDGIRLYLEVYHRWVLAFHRQFFA